MADGDSWIDAIEFPATKIDLIEAADESGAPQDVIERLQALNSEQYESREELDAELGADA
jgi:Protein of unknown function (DUF2795)